MELGKIKAHHKLFRGTRELHFQKLTVARVGDEAKIPFYSGELNNTNRITLKQK